MRVLKEKSEGSFFFRFVIKNFPTEKTQLKMIKENILIQLMITFFFVTLNNKELRNDLIKTSDLVNKR